MRGQKSKQRKNSVSGRKGERNPREVNVVGGARKSALRPKKQRNKKECTKSKITKTEGKKGGKKNTNKKGKERYPATEDR